MHRNGVVSAVLTISVFAYLLVAGGASPAAGAACDRYASNSGSDGNDGLAAATAVRNLRTLVPLLQPGQTGCIVGPTFSQVWDGWGQVVSGGGTLAAPVTIRSSDPLNPTTYSGPMVLDANVHDVIIRDLHFTGAPSPGQDHGWNLIQINGDRIQLRDNDITDPMAICVGAGTLDAYGGPVDPGAVVADALVIDGNTIHGCGASITNWQPGESGVHAVYLVNTTNAQITNNTIYGAIDRGIQLWPHALATTIEYNVLDANGANLNIGSYSTNGFYSQDTTIRYNLITNSVLRSINSPPPNFPPGDTVQINGNFPSNATPTQYANVVTQNCIYQADSGLNFGGYGYAQSSNTFADPVYADPGTHDYAISQASPCAGWGPGGAPSTSSPTELSIAGKASVPTGRRVKVHGVLTSGDMACADTKELSVTAGATQVSVPVTNALGEYVARIKVTHRSTLRAWFAGDAGCEPSSSPRLVIRVT